MTEKIKKLLSIEGIENYLIVEVEREVCELYFVRRRLDMKRAVSTHRASVSVYRDEVRENEKLRGVAEVLVFSDMDDDEIRQKLSDAYRTALYSLAPEYPLCEPSDAHREFYDKGKPLSLECMAAGYADAIFKYDTDEKTYVNCAEIYASSIRTRISNSAGVDVSYTEYRCDGELVVTSKDGEDVELFDYFSYQGECYTALSERVRELLFAVRDRAKAKRMPLSGEYSLILEGECCRELFGYYLWKADAKNIHTGYSEAKLGDSVAESGGVGANITCCAVHPFSREGIPSRDIQLTEGGVLSSYVGDMRFSSYIGARPTGEYEKISVRQGDISLSEMKAEPYLHVVGFSDFQVDPLDGYFGGEIRLAYLYDGERVYALTGGSVSSNVSKLRDCAVASSELYESYDYKGPRAIKIKGVSLG